MIPFLALASMMGDGPSSLQLNDVPRLRTQFSNRSQCLVDRIPGATTACVQLWVRAGAYRDRYETHGYRHVLEHFQAEGFDGRLDATLEPQGIFVSASTGRHAMVFQFRCAPDQVPIAIAACGLILRPRPLTPEMIAQEAETIREEMAGRSSTSRFSEFAWSTAYGEDGLDPYGKVETISAATPAKLGDLWTRMTSPEHLAIVVAGNVEVDSTTALVSKVLADRKGALLPPLPPPARDAVATPVSVNASGMYAKVGPYREIQTAAALVAGFGIAHRTVQPFLLYQPTNTPGLVVVGSPTPGVAWGRLRLEAETAEAFMIGQAGAHDWLDRQLRDPILAATLRGGLLVQSPSLSPQQLRENLAQVTFAQYRRALGNFVPLGGN
ncbi:MAG: insulinase family protein [Fimbriimonadaceae bacterium]|nr:insulinase family protein [Fimbriimonadaceae bacterium]